MDSFIPFDDEDFAADDADTPEKQAVQLIRSDDPDLKLQATKQIIHLTKYGPFKLVLSGSIETLVSMLRVDSPESHCESAFLALRSLASNDEKNRIKIVEAGVLEPIIRVLQSQSLLEVLATEFLCFLSASAIKKPVIGSSSAIPLLVKILRHGSPQSKSNAISALFRLSKNPINLNIILGTNPIPPIVNLLKTSSKLSEPAERCCALIESLLGFDEGRTLLTSKEGGILAVVEMFKFGPPKIQEHALEVLLTICKSDRYNYEELILREGIIPGLEKFTIEGTPKSKSKAQMLFLLLRKVPRVTIHRLNDEGKQVHRGVHFVTIDYLKGSNELGLFITSEEDCSKSLLHRIGPDDIYEKREDRLISWRDTIYSTELTLGFQETKECSYIWDHICNVQNLHFNTVNTSLRRRIGGSTRESNNSSSDTIINVEEDNGNDDRKAHHNREGLNPKVTLEWIFVIANFILELLSTVFDQLSSMHKPEYALIAMLMSFVAMLLCIVELIYKGQKERVLWRWRGRIPWFYYPSPSDVRFGTFTDIVGLGCAVPQFIVTTINYCFSRRHADTPIKLSVWPIIFAFGLLCSKLFQNTNKTPSSRLSP